MSERHSVYPEPEKVVIVEDDRTSMHRKALERAFLDHLAYMRGRQIESATTLAWSHLLKLHLLVLGVTIMLVVLLLPEGAQGFVARHWPAVRTWLKRRS